MSTEERPDLQDMRQLLGALETTPTRRAGLTRNVADLSRATVDPLRYPFVEIAAPRTRGGKLRVRTHKPQGNAEVRIHTVREANNNVSAIIASALQGLPQAITKQGAGAVVVMSVERAAELMTQAGRPRTLGNMFAATDNNPPVEALAVPSRPGRTRISF
jgi:prevent-host-death family protein